MTMTTTTRCQAAHATDTSSCEGATQAVSLRDRKGTTKLGCVHHAARAIATISGLTVGTGPHGYQGYAWNDSASRAAIRRARELAPYDWQGVRVTTDPENCPECGSDELTEYSYDGGKTVTGYECRDCGHNWRA